MLFHVTMRHDNANCAGLNAAIREKTMAMLPTFKEAGAKYGVTVLGMYNALPNHVEFLVADAPGPDALAFYLSEVTPYEADFETYAVIELDELAQKAKAMGALT